MLSHTCGILLPVKMRYGDDLPTHVIIESVDTVGVDEAVSYPAACLHDLLNLPDNLKGMQQNI